MVNAATVTEPEDMDVDSADAFGSQTKSTPGPTAASSGAIFTFRLKSLALQSDLLADRTIAPRQGITVISIESLTSIRTEHTALGDRSKFLAKVKEILHTRDIEMAGISTQGNKVDTPLTQKEFYALKPLSAPPSLQEFPINRRKHVLCRMLRKAKHMNNKAASMFEERL
jgi:hypothetical protein